jgi:tetratricopeptide (TPR) repeat protein
LLRPHLALLEQTDQIFIWDDRQIDAGGEWYEHIRQTMERAAVTICLISADYLASDFCQKEEIPFLLNRRKQDGMLLIPLLVRPCLWRAVPWLRQLQMLPRDGKSVAKDFKDNHDEIFTLVAEQTYEFVSQLQPITITRASKSATDIHVSGERNIIINGNLYQATLSTGDLTALPPPQWPALPVDKVSIERLPVTDKTLFGRDDDLNQLDELWETNSTNVLSFIAWGGVGKSTLVNKWLEQMQADHYRGAQRVYAWSFYSQGTTERATSAEFFIASALEWFGDADPNAGSPWDKGERLADLIRRERTLLVLDGVEPLQSSFAHERGKLKDPALLRLLEELAHDNPGLCLITTRERLTDLDELQSDTARQAVLQRDLEKLSPASARALLRAGGVRGTDAELEAGANAFGCHALALSLLAEYLRDVPGHHISAAEQIPELELPPDEQKDRPARRMIDALANKLNTGPELNVLRMLGLYDRPADEASLRAIRKRPVIAGLTDHVGLAKEARWLRAVQRLRQAKLLAPESHHTPGELDAHPLVHEHFGQQLQRQHPDAWRAANLRLYEHLCATTKELPDTVEEMAPLFAAVAHGCAAGRHQQVIADVYLRRILRGEGFFSTRKLGAYGAGLAALTGFFETPWRHPIAGFTEDYQAFVLNEAGFNLRALGRLQEAVEPMQAGLQANISQKDWQNAARSVGTLSDVYLTIGDLPQALEFAQQGVALADRSGDQFLRIANKAMLANTLHQAGQAEEAAAAFRQAEEMEKQRHPEYTLLYSLRGFQYCDLLLDQGKHQEVKERAARTIEWVKQHGFLLDIAQDNLSLGRAWLLQSRQAGAGDYGQAAEFLQRAVDGMRQAGTMNYLPRGLLARAELRRVTGDYQRARTDLDEAQRLAERSQMGLHLADCHLERARLCLATAEREEARAHWTKAKEMIEQMGYHRRDGELKEIAEQLGETA